MVATAGVRSRPGHFYGPCDRTADLGRAARVIPTMVAARLTGSLPGGTYINGSGLPSARARNLFSLGGAIVTVQCYIVAYLPILLNQ